MVTAFLVGDLGEIIYMKVPKEMTAISGQCYRLRKSLYGLKQAARVFFDLIAGILERNGYSPVSADRNIFTDGKTYIAVYVDDLLIVEELAGVKKVKDILQKHLNIKDLEEVSVWLGLRIQRDLRRKILLID